MLPIALHHSCSRPAGRCPLKSYTTEQIRNVALVAHHGVGKT